MITVCELLIFEQSVIKFCNACQL